MPKKTMYQRRSKKSYSDAMKKYWRKRRRNANKK